MKCADVRDLLHPFLDGELEVEKNVAVLKHLELCPACQARSEQETRLREVLARGAREELSPAERRRLVTGALDRAEGAEGSGSGRITPLAGRRRPVLVRALAAAAAAALLLAAGGAWLYLADPYCWHGCDTMAVLFQARERLDAAPQPLDEVEARFARELEVPRLVGPACVGADCVVDADGAPRLPLVRYACGAGAEFGFLTIPGGHAHVGERRRLPDGKEYLVVDRGGLRFVGWIAADGALVGCLPGAGLAEERLVTLAAALRVEADRRS